MMDVGVGSVRIERRSPPPADPELETELLLRDAAHQREPAKVRMLLAGGTDPDAADGHGQTALHHAVGWDDEEGLAVLDALAECGADLDKADNDGATPLMLAAKNGCSGALRRLLELGADHTPVDHDVGVDRRVVRTWAGRVGMEDRDAWQNRDGKTALELAQAKGKHAVAAVLQAWAAGTRDTAELDRLAAEAPSDEEEEDDY